jgi:hypothetical protein
MRETIEQFLARGGSIAKVPAQEQPAVKHILPVKSTSSMDIIDLAGGAELYSEPAMAGKSARKVKIGKRNQKININKDLLPPGLIGLLNTIGVSKDAARQQEEDFLER